MGPTADAAERLRQTENKPYLGVGQPEEEVILQLFDLFAVALHLLHEPLPLLLQLMLLLEDQLAQQLVFQACHGHSEVNQGDLQAVWGAVLQSSHAVEPSNKLCVTLLQAELCKEKAGWQLCNAGRQLRLLTLALSSGV